MTTVSGPKLQKAPIVLPHCSPTPILMDETDLPPPESRLLDHDGFAWFVFVCMLLVAVVLWQLSARQIERRTHDRFLHLANKEGNAIHTRMQAYEQVLRGAEALFAASVHVSRAEWQAYIQTLQLDGTLPGILGTGYAVVIPTDQHHGFQELDFLAAGFPDERGSPPGRRDLISSIIYLEPFTQRNRRALGYDMYSEPVRRTAMARARDSGEAALSGKVTLLQEFDTGIQPGFLMYLPVYRDDRAHDDVSSRRSALKGFVYSPFRAHDLMNGVLQASGRDLELELFDGVPRAENLLYASAEASRVAQHMTDVSIQIAGRLWTARVRSSNSFEAAITSVQPLLILATGDGLAFTLFAMLLINARHRRKIRVAAAALERSLDSHRTLVENVPGTVFRSQTAFPWICGLVSANIEVLIGEPPERFLSGAITYRQFTHPDDMQMVLDAVETALTERSTYNIEYRICTRNNQISWVAERGRATYSATGQSLWLDGVILDVTDRKEAELAIRDLAFIDPLTGLPNRRRLTDRLTQQIAVTGRSKRYDALLFIDMDNFKSVNDSLGHGAGDLLLIEVARRLHSNVRENDTVARLGGDEFVLILDDLADNDIHATILARQIGEKLISALNQPYQLEGQLQRSSPSLGITIYSGHKATVDELLRQADQAMYVAKSAGRNCLKVHDTECAI